MAELPELPKHLLRLHTLRWKDLIEKCGLTGGHLDWHQSPQKRREAAKPPYGLLPPPPGSRKTFKGKQGEKISYQDWLKSQKEAWAARQNDPGVIDSIGIAATITLAKERFTSIVGDYFALWASDKERDSDEFPQWLERLRQSVGDEVGDLWRKGEWHTAWFQRACRKKVDDALGLLDNEWVSKARRFEIEWLESQNKPTFSGADLEQPNLGSQSYEDAFAEFEKNYRNGPTAKQSLQPVSPADSGVAEACQMPATEDDTRMPTRAPDLTKHQQDRIADAEQLSARQRNLLFAIGDGHLSGDGSPFIFVRNRTGSALSYRDGREVQVDADEMDLRHLRSEGFIILERLPGSLIVLTGQPRQLGIDTAASLRSKRLVEHNGIVSVAINKAEVIDPVEAPPISASPEQNIEQAPAKAELPPQRKGTLSEVPDLDERKATYDAYKRKCKDAGVKITEEKLARLANQKWHTRDPVMKWKESKDRPGDDRLIRRAMEKGPPATQS